MWRIQGIMNKTQDILRIKKLMFLKENEEETSMKSMTSSESEEDKKSGTVSHTKSNKFKAYQLFDELNSQ